MSDKINNQPDKNDTTQAQRLFEEYKHHSHFRFSLATALSEGNQQQISVFRCDDKDHFTEDLERFFLTCPEIERVDFRMINLPNDLPPIEFNQKLRSATRQAKIRQISINMYSRNDQPLLEDFATNPHIDKVHIYYNLLYTTANQLYDLETDLSSLSHTCRNAPFQLHLYFTNPSGQNEDSVSEQRHFQRFWLSIGKKLTNLDTLTELTFSVDTIRKPFYCCIIAPTLSYGKIGKLSLKYNEIDNTIGSDFFAILFHSVREISFSTIPESHCHRFFNLLTDSRSKVESIDIGIQGTYLVAKNGREITLVISARRLKYLERYAPHFAPSLKSLSVALGLDDLQPPTAAIWKRRVLKALWLNHNLTKRIKLTGPGIDDADRATVQHILSRNRSRKQIIEQNQLGQKVPNTKWSALLQHSVRSGLHWYMDTHNQQTSPPHNEISTDVKKHSNKQATLIRRNHDTTAEIHQLPKRLRTKQE